MHKKVDFRAFLKSFFSSKCKNLQQAVFNKHKTRSIFQKVFFSSQKLNQKCAFLLYDKEEVEEEEKGKFCSYCETSKKFCMHRYIIKNHY